MTLKLAGEEIGIQEVVKQIAYNPGVQNSDDLETATKTITATAEASGLANADYTKALTLTTPGDTALEILRVVARLAVTIDSFDTATHLYCRVYVDAQDAEHLLFDADFTGTGAKLAAEDTYSGNKATIFNLLKDGSAHTFYFFFWIDQVNNAVISAVQLWEGVGSKSSGWWPIDSCLAIHHQGLASVYTYLDRVGSGSVSGRIIFSNDNAYLRSLGTETATECLVLNNNQIWVRGTVATDLNYLSKIQVVLKNLL